MNKLIIIGSIFFIFSGCDQQKNITPLKKKRIAEVETTIVKSTKWQESIVSYGVVEAAKEVKLTTDFSGKVQKVLFKEGQTVKRGQELVKFNSNKRKLRLQNTEASVKNAKAHLDNSRQEAKRTRKLFYFGNTSRAVYDAAEAQLRQAMARYEQTITAKRLAMRELRESKLISPVTGIVEKCSVTPGEVVLPGQLLGTIQVVATVRIVTYVSEKDINHLRVGAEAEVISSGVAGRVYNARIESLAIKAETQTGNFKVKLMIQNSEGLLRPGMTAKATLKGLEIEDAIVVSERILVDRQRRKVLYIIEDNKAIEVEPVLGTSPNDQVLVFQGLKDGDQLVVDGIENIIHGSDVRIKEKK